jgi:hypothetical protein
MKKPYLPEERGIEALLIKTENDLVLPLLELHLGVVLLHLCNQPRVSRLTITVPASVVDPALSDPKFFGLVGSGSRISILLVQEIICATIKYEFDFNKWIRIRAQYRIQLFKI